MPSITQTRRGAKPAQSDPRQQAVKTLRYPGTPSAAREMAHRLSGMDSDWDFTAGLSAPLRGKRRWWK